MSPAHLTPEDPPDITRLLRELQDGITGADQRAIAAIYNELRRLARKQMAGERRNHTLQSTALVHEAYLRLAGLNQVPWTSRAHFFAVASQIMQHILADYARKRRAAKRGGGRVQVELDEAMVISDDNLDNIVLLDQALEKLKKADGRQAQIVAMRLFGGLSHVEIGEFLGISEKTVKRDWTHAQAWLYAELQRRSAGASA